MVCIILHKSHTCKLCAEWAHHYTYSTLDGETSLFHAEAQQETIILTSLTAEHATLKHHYDALQQANAALQLNNSSLQQTNASLLCELNIIRINLAREHDDLTNDHH
jgi:hypothetical protein